MRPLAARPRLVPRAPRAALLTLGVLVGAAACRGARDAAAEERARGEQEVRRLAEQAGRLAAETPSTDTGTRVSVGDAGAGRLARGGDPPLGPGDVRVTSTDGAIVLAVIGDTVRTRLGDSVVQKVEREMAADADTAGFGGFVARTVKGAVSGAMSAATGFALRVPVREVRDMEYRDGELRLRTGPKSTTAARFAPADAERFMAAVRERQRRPSGR